MEIFETSLWRSQFSNRVIGDGPHFAMLCRGKGTLEMGRGSAEKKAGTRMNATWAAKMGVGWRNGRGNGEGEDRNRTQVMLSKSG